MYVIDADTKITSLTNFVDTNYDSPEEFILMACKALLSVPIDCFSVLTYTYAHLMYGRIKSLEAKEKEELIAAGILWDIAKLISNQSLLKINKEDAFEELLAIYEVAKPSQAEMTSILVYDAAAPDYSDSTLEYMKQSVVRLGYYSTSFTSVFKAIRGYLFK